MKHLKIISNDKVLFDGEIKCCQDCPVFDRFAERCSLIEVYVKAKELNTFCPLEDKV